MYVIYQYDGGWKRLKGHSYEDYWVAVENADRLAQADPDGRYEINYHVSKRKVAKKA